MSNGEIAWCGDRLRKWCVGNGVDLGFGGAPICPTAICIDRPEGHPERAVVPAPVPPTHFAGDVTNLPFKDRVMDYVFSSHVLEDFVETRKVMDEWCRILKVGGRLVMFLPDQPQYEEQCRKDGSLPNGAHKHPNFGLAWVRANLPDCMREIHSMWPVPGNPYSFDFVAEKIR